MRLKRLPKVSWDISEYSPDYYGYGDVDIYVDDSYNVGERVICIFRKKDLIKYNDNKCKDFTFCILCNSCGIKSGITSLLGLNAGQIIPVRFNGEFNPTIPLEWINKRFWRI